MKNKNLLTALNLSPQLNLDDLQPCLTFLLYIQHFILFPYYLKIYFISLTLQIPFKCSTHSQLESLFLTSLVGQKLSEKNYVTLVRKLNWHPVQRPPQIVIGTNGFFLPTFISFNSNKITEDKVQECYGSSLIVTELYSYFSVLLILINCLYPQVWLTGTKWLQDFQSRFPGRKWKGKERSTQLQKNQIPLKTFARSRNSFPLILYHHPILMEVWVQDSPNSIVILCVSKMGRMHIRQATSNLYDNFLLCKIFTLDLCQKSNKWYNFDWQYKVFERWVVLSNWSGRAFFWRDGI